MKVLNYGSLNYDYTYQVSHMVTAGETLSAESLEIRCGGKGLNQSVALSRAGIRVSHAGMVGEDGSMLLEQCTREGIDTAFIRECQGKCGHAMIQVDPEGENCIIVYGGANRKNSKEQIEEVLSHFGEGDIVLLQNEINEISELIFMASEKGMKIWLNPSPFEEKLKNCGLEKVDVFLINETEGQQMTGESASAGILKKLEKQYPGAEVVLTLGADGVCYSDGTGTVISVPAFKVQTVDTTAAGDTFTGYYLSGILQERSREETLRRACAAAALAVTREGAADSIPTAREVDLFLSERSYTERCFDPGEPTAEGTE